MKQVITDYIENIHSLCNSLDTEQLNKACELMLESYKSGKQIFVAGNGGSEAHLTIFVVTSAKMP